MAGIAAINSAETEIADTVERIFSINMRQELSKRRIIARHRVV
jgi:hypothetical protein